MKFVSVPNPARILLLAAPLFGALALSTICLKPGPAGRPTSSAHPADRVVACAATAAGSIGIQPSITATAGAHDSARAMPRAVRFAAVDAILPDLPGAARDWRTFAPESLTVAVVPGCPLTFHRVSREDDSRSITWTGGNGLPGVALVGVGTSAGWDAILTVPGANDFEIHVRGLRASVCEIDPGLDHCGNETAPRLRADQAGRESIGGGTAGRAAAVTNAATVDVVFFFDGEAVQAAARRAPDGNGESLLVSTLQARTVLCNFALGQSGVTNFEWHDVGARRIPAYTRTGKMNDDLAELTSGGDEAGRFMAAQAAALCADQAVLVVGGGTDYAGLAWVPGHESVIAWDTSYQTLAHELAHNFGCLHDRQTDHAADNDGVYAYGYRFDYAGRDCGDIMSYAGFRLPYFSNPKLMLEMSTHVVGLPAGRIALGVADDKPQAADAARTLREHAEAMAQSRLASLFAPAIAVQPANRQVEEGGGVTLSVAATGGDLTYQWQKNGVAIAGANEASLTIAATSLATAGTYDCVITNARGSVTTQPAIVSVATASSRKIPAPSTGGSLVNLSARASVRGGDGNLIGGLVVAGGPGEMLVRAVGPGLQNLGVSNFLRDPRLQALDVSGRVIAQNDNWGDHADAGALASLASSLGAFALSDGSKDAVLQLTLDPGCYTFNVAGTDGGTGVALLEIYLVSSSGMPGRLINLSARSYCGTDSEAMVVGFVTRGATQVLARAVGPTLEKLGVQGALTSAGLEVYDSGQLADRVGVWGATYATAQASALFSHLGAFALPADSADAIDILTLPGGAIRTVQVKGQNSATGIALAEVYLVEP